MSMSKHHQDIYKNEWTAKEVVVQLGSNFAEILTNIIQTKK